MTKSVLFRLEGESTTYHIDLSAGVVTRFEEADGVSLDREPPVSFQGIDFAVVRDARPAPATFPMFADS